MCRFVPQNLIMSLNQGCFKHCFIELLNDICRKVLEASPWSGRVTHKTHSKIFIFLLPICLGHQNIHLVQRFSQINRFKQGLSCARGRQWCGTIHTTDEQLQ